MLYFPERERSWVRVFGVIEVVFDDVGVPDTISTPGANTYML